ncbi:MAG: amidohydrolase [Acidobacteriota bacterium]
MRTCMHGVILGIALFSLPSVSLAQQSREDVGQAIQDRADEYRDMAMEIWNLAELGYMEEKSSRVLQEQLRESGFEVTSGVAAIPTAFVASYGSGKPVIGVLAEFDALPGLSQEATPMRQVRTEGAAGHACGHHLFGTASTAAAIAVKDWLVSSGQTGTIRLYGTPAEEGGSGKVYMVRAGLFDDADVVLHWHPGDANDASPRTTLANRSAKFRFRGISAHAAAAPERGRSALDGVEAMNTMVNLMREHVPQETRIHYVITQGGLAPNVVPEVAEVYYYVRHPSSTVLDEIWERVEQAARGAAMGTGTTFDREIIHGNHRILTNLTLARLVQANLERLGGVHYSAEEQAFAERIRQTLGRGNLPLGSEQRIQPFQEKLGMGSSDVGDVSWAVPTAGLRTATWVPGTAAHTWQAVAAGGTEIGIKGMLLAAKVLATTAVDILKDPSVVEEARLEWQERLGPDFHYEALLGDRDPPLDYRK